MLQKQLLLSISVTSLTLSTSRTFSLLLIKPQIAQSRSSFQHKLKRQTDEGRLFYLKEHYDITMGLYPIRKEQKKEQTHSSFQHTFSYTVRAFH